MELLTYLLKVSACTVLFFAFYLLVLRRLTFFKTNRFYLIVTLLLSFIIPTLKLTIEREVPAAAVVFNQPTIVNQETEVSQIQIPNQIDYSTIAEESFDWYSVLPYFYFGIVACLLIIATWRILQLVKHTKNGAERINGLKIVSKTNGFTNCSFFNYVFIDNKNLTEAELQVLLKHEQVHAQQLHSVDKVLLIIAKAFLWFNPVVYLYDKALEQAHEYEADEATSQSFGTEQYANLLLRLAIAKSEMPLVHNFVKSPIKARIKMLFNSKSKNMKKLMYLLAVPVGLGLLWGFTVKVVEVYKSPDIKNEKSVVKESRSLDTKLWGKTLKGKVKSILQTEVGEILNFNYAENTIEIFNHAKGKVKVGDELMIKISGTVNDISVTDSKGNVIKELEKPCYGMSKLINAKGVVLFDLDDVGAKKQISTQLKITKQDTAKLKLDKKIRAMLNKTVKGKVISFSKSNKIEVLNLQVGNEIIPIWHSEFKDKLKIKTGDEITVTINGSVSFIPPPPKGTNLEYANLKPSFVASKVITRNSSWVYKLPNHAFLYEANKARSATSKIKSIINSKDGTISRIILNDKGFTINLDMANQKFMSQNFKVGDSVLVKFIGEQLVARNTYNTDKMIVLYSRPKKYELKNKVLFDRFYNEDGTQKVSKVAVTKPNAEMPKTVLENSTGLTVDTKTNIHYVKNGLIRFGKQTIEAEEMIYDKARQKLEASKATITHADGTVITGKDLKYDFLKGTYKMISKSVSASLTNNKVNLNLIKYRAKDSTIINNKTGDVYLYGKANVENGNQIYQSDQMVYNRINKTLKAKTSVIIDDKKNNTTVTADSLFTNFVTGKGILYGKVLIKDK